jgi:hypothetical protein
MDSLRNILISGGCGAVGETPPLTPALSPLRGEGGGVSRVYSGCVEVTDAFGMSSEPEIHNSVFPSREGLGVGFSGDVCSSKT